jgi:hypothetical protein
MSQFQLGEKKGTGPMPEKGEKKEKKKNQVELWVGKRQMGWVWSPNYP